MMEEEIKSALILDLVEWVALQPRPYSDVMAAWRTTCPRLTIWEDCVDKGFVQRAQIDDTRGSVVRVTETGLAHLTREGRLPRRSA